ncbi:thiolase family protein [Streptomyces gilvus]|uniref:thiolase family protein n=1 Tax=Streptomyces gilvus TaxID=2920937 RepID=UPI001F0E78AD|nr:thiolase family protein [Streptomyces sp. CME 23]MCH5675617.1 thiolase family protein [Streptomyces sp. CME 23]
MPRNPVKDQVAIVGVGSTGFSRQGASRSRDALVAQACIDAVRDAGVGKQEIDGVCGGLPRASTVVSMLGLPEVTHYVNHPPPFGFTIVDAMNAIHAGSADVVLAYHAMYRSPFVSRSAASDPLRRHLGWAGEPIGRPWRTDPEQLEGSPGYAAWASRYLHEYGVRREQLGYVAVNNRTNAADNPLAAMRDPLTMEDYLGARMVRDPLCMLDMDVPVDGADAFVLTTAERARDLTDHPVLIHAATTGTTAKNDEDQISGLGHHGQQVVAKELRAKSDIWVPDVDVYFPYDGFSFITLSWIENVGWCGEGEGGAFVESHWEKEANRIMIDGRVPVNPHGGSLSEGATQGSGHIREAVVQLRGDAGDRQVAGARSALLTLGGFFFNAQGLVLRQG